MESCALTPRPWWCDPRLNFVANQVEGLQAKAADAVRAAWLQLDVVQCGYCQSGQVMAAASLLAKNPTPSNADIDTAMAGNLCRCGT